MASRNAGADPGLGRGAEVYSWGRSRKEEIKHGLSGGHSLTGKFSLLRLNLLLILTEIDQLNEPFHDHQSATVAILYFKGVMQRVQVEL